MERQFVLPRRATGSYHLTRQRTLFFSFAYSSGDMPLGTYACSFVAWRVGADEWKAWAPPNANAITTEVLMAAEALDSLLREDNLSLQLIHRLQRCSCVATRTTHESGRDLIIG